MKTHKPNKIRKNGYGDFKVTCQNPGMCLPLKDQWESEKNTKHFPNTKVNKEFLEVFPAQKQCYSSNSYEPPVLFRKGMLRQLKTKTKQKQKMTREK